MTICILKSQGITSQLQPSITSPKTTTGVTQLTSTSAVVSANVSEVTVSVEGPSTSEQQIASMRLRTQGEGGGLSEMERSWVEVQRKKKSSRVEGKVRGLLTLLCGSLIMFFLSSSDAFRVHPNQLSVRKLKSSILSLMMTWNWVARNTTSLNNLSMLLTFLLLSSHFS